MDAAQFERACKRIDPRLEVKRGLHPQVVRYLKRGFDRGLNRQPYYTVWRRGDITNYPYVVLTIQDPDGLPRPPYDRDLHTIASAGVKHLLRKGDQATKATVAQLEREKLNNTHAQDEARARVDLAKEFQDIARYSLHKDFRTQYDAGIRVGMGGGGKWQHNRGL